MIRLDIDERLWNLTISATNLLEKIEELRADSQAHIDAGLDLLLLIDYESIEDEVKELKKVLNE